MNGFTTLVEFYIWMILLQVELGNGYILLSTQSLLLLHLLLSHFASFGYYWVAQLTLVSCSDKKGL